MSGIKPKVKPVKLICGVTFNSSIDIDSSIEVLTDNFGATDFVSSVFNFDNSDYYEDEMGTNLKKLFYSFENLIQPDDLADIKNKTISIESTYSDNNKRNINLDPGYLEESKLVLASTKNFSHRIYQKDSIWAEVTLVYTNNEFRTHPWTYPDYSSGLAFKFFKQVRNKFRSQLTF